MNKFIFDEIDRAFDEIQSIQDHEEIKKKNKTRTTCISCGAKTKSLYNFNYCPHDCDKELDIKYKNLDFDLTF